MWVGTMTEPVLSKDALAKMLRLLADRVDRSGDEFEVGMETEEIGRATKTTITLWALRRPNDHAQEIATRRVTPWAAPAAEIKWCDNSRPNYNGTGWRPCRTLLRDNGSCPNASDHMHVYDQRRGL